MDPPSPIVFRRRVLTNPAAEFVERRAGVGVIRQLEGPLEGIGDLENVPEFSPEFDRFVRKGQVFDIQSVYEESEKGMVKFQQTLKILVATLKERKIDTELGISIQDPSEFTLEGILSIINRIKESKNDAKTRTCKNFARRCYRRFEDNRDVVDAVLSMLPNDIYGSVISGGATLIMAAVETRAKQREAIHSFLAEIPEKLQKIQRLSDIHHASPGLHLRADAVMVAIFVVLGSIVDELTSTWKIKIAEGTAKLASFIPTMSNRHGQNVDNKTKVRTTGKVKEEDLQGEKVSVSDALAKLQDQIQGFQAEVDICSQERLGRVEEGITVLKGGLVCATRRHERLAEQSLRTIENLLTRTTKETREELLLGIHDCLYQVFTSSPFFNAKNGDVNLEQVRLSQIEYENVSIRSQQKSNSRIVKEWCKGLQGATYDPIIDITDCLEHIEQLDHDEKNVAQSILHSEQVKSWLQERQSSIIEISLQTPPSTLNNPLSFNSALFAMTLQGTAQFPVLSFFAMHRNNESPLEDESGPAALVQSLNVQLLKFIAASRPSVDISKVKDQMLLLSTKSTLKSSLRLLEALVLSLPENDTVFFIIDSVSRLSGDEEDSVKVFKKLRKIIRKAKQVAIKVMVTSTLAGSYLQSIVDIPLYCQDLVNGIGAIDIEESGDEIAKHIRGGRDANHRDSAAVTLDEESEDEDDDDDEEDEEDEEDDDDDDDGDEDEDTN
ncbi:hypothetical protein F5Y04DRAFT_288095 [Hypomontagnella monticulosa]|nr:hypothetical protein F5Y04DRAFT_288095 [Hypomontagnella monticulosa]